MRTLLIAIIMLASLLENGWCQNLRPTTPVDLAKYAGADRERLLYDGAKKEAKPACWIADWGSRKSHDGCASWFISSPPPLVPFHRRPLSDTFETGCWVCREWSSVASPDLEAA